MIISILYLIIMYLWMYGIFRSFFDLDHFWVLNNFKLLSSKLKENFENFENSNGFISNNLGLGLYDSLFFSCIKSKIFIPFSMPTHFVSFLSFLYVYLKPLFLGVWFFKCGLDHLFEIACWGCIWFLRGIYL